MRELQNYTTCIVCGSSEAYILASAEQLASERRYLDSLFRKLFYPDAPEYMLKDHIFFTHTYEGQLVVCKNCGLVCRDPRLSARSALQEYADDEYHLEWLESSFQPYYESYLPEMPRLIKMVGSKAKVLEVGSQIGGFLAAAREYGWHAQGVDVGQCVSVFARTKGFEVITGTLSQAGFQDNSFDAVFVWLCFEMLPDPWSELKEIHRILAKGGRLFISVPNGDFIKLIQPFKQVGVWTPLRNQLWKHLAYAILLGFPFQLGYTPDSLRYILSRSSFENIQIRNQLYIPITSPKYVFPWVFREKKLYLTSVHYLTEILYQASFRRLVKGPWIEVMCQKESKT